MLFVSSGSPSAMSATKSTSAASLTSELIHPAATCEPHPQFRRRICSLWALGARPRRALEPRGIQHLRQDLACIEVLFGDLPRGSGVPGPVATDLVDCFDCAVAVG